MKYLLSIVLSALLTTSLAAHPKDDDDWLYILGSNDWGHNNDSGRYVVIHEREWIRLIYDRTSNKYIIHLDDPEINDETYTVLRGMLEEIDEAGNNYVTEVFLNSPGGNAGVGMAVGRLFRENSVYTIVTRGQNCSSACAMMFIGGAFRDIRENGKVGVHAPYLVGSYGTRQCATREDDINEDLGFKDYVDDMISDDIRQLGRDSYNQTGAADTFYNTMMDKCDAWGMEYFRNGSIIETVETQPPTFAPGLYTPSELAKPYLQVGSFQSKSHADSVARRIKANGVSVKVTKFVNGDNQTFWRVTAGPAATQSEMNKIRNIIARLGFTSVFQVSEVDSTLTNPCQTRFAVGSTVCEGEQRYRVMFVPATNQTLKVNINKAWVFAQPSGEGDSFVKLQKGTRVTVRYGYVTNNRVQVSFRYQGEPTIGWMHITVLENLNGLPMVRKIP